MRAFFNLACDVTPSRQEIPQILKASDVGQAVRRFCQLVEVMKPLEKYSPAEKTFFSGVIVLKT